jgi:hypothetical protein
MTYKIPAVSTVSHQFPEFVKEDYPKFIRFVELYYEFLKTSELEGVGESFNSIRDVDNTLDKFIDSLWKEFGINVPRTNVANDIHFLKHIKDFYSSKGSEESFKILFRHLFNIEIDIKYPAEYIFKPSDGEWQQDVSFLVNVSHGDIYSIVGKQIYINSASQTILVNVIKIQQLGSYFEVFIEPTVYNIISVGDKISLNDFDATIINSITKVDVVSSGSGFYRGQLITITTPTGTNALLKVSDVDSSGGILKIEVINFGVGYVNPFYVYVPNFPYLVDKIGLKESFLVTKNIVSDFFVVSGYVDDSYFGTLVTQLSSDTSTPDYSLDETSAYIKINTGSVRKYKGYYKSERGFVSNSYKLQDSVYYQLYSYVINCSESINTYRDIVKTLVHPTGMKLFGTQVLSNEIFLINTLEILEKFINVSPIDFLSVNEICRFAVSKGLSNEVVIDELQSFIFRKGAISESVSVSESKSFEISKFFTENILITDTIYNSLNNSLPESVLIGELQSFILNKGLPESVSVSESKSFVLNKGLTESVSVSESKSFVLNKGLIDAISILGFEHWVSDYNVDYVNTETPAVITYSGSTFSITLNN